MFWDILQATGQESVLEYTFTVHSFSNININDLSKGQFGFLSYEQEEGKKLFFHMSEVEGGEILQVGDEVEFVVVTNQRTRKHSACCVRKLW